jgi:hypothetical protein
VGHHQRLTTFLAIAWSEQRHATIYRVCALWSSIKDASRTLTLSGNVGARRWRPWTRHDRAGTGGLRHGGLSNLHHMPIGDIIRCSTNLVPLFPNKPNMPRLAGSSLRMFKLCALKRNTVLQAPRFIAQPVGSLGKPLPKTHLTLKAVGMELGTRQQAVPVSMEQPSCTFLNTSSASRLDPAMGKHSNGNDLLGLGWVTFVLAEPDTHEGGPALTQGEQRTQKHGRSTAVLPCGTAVLRY